MNNMWMHNSINYQFASNRSSLVIFQNDPIAPKPKKIYKHSCIRGGIHANFNIYFSNSHFSSYSCLSIQINEFMRRKFWLGEKNLLIIIFRSTQIIANPIVILLVWEWDYCFLHGWSLWENHFFTSYKEGIDDIESYATWGICAHFDFWGRHDSQIECCYP